MPAYFELHFLITSCRSNVYLLFGDFAVCIVTSAFFGFNAHANISYSLYRSEISHVFNVQAIFAVFIVFFVLLCR